MANLAAGVYSPSSKAWQGILKSVVPNDPAMSSSCSIPGFDHAFGYLSWRRFAFDGAIKRYVAAFGKPTLASEFVEHQGRQLQKPKHQ